MTTKYMKWLLPVAVCAAVSSCALGPKYERPKLAGMPSALDDSMPIEVYSLGDADWRTVYHDSLLQRLIDTALAYNQDLRIAAYRVAECGARRRVATAELFPSVTGSFYAQKEGTNYGGEGYANDPEAGLKAQLSWELDLWGYVRHGRRKALAEYLASVEGQRAVQVSLVSAVADAYYELVALDNELTIVRQTLLARRESERLAKLRFEGGLTSETPYQQARFEYQRTATRVPMLERDIAMKENELSLLTGCFPGSIARSESCIEDALSGQLPVGMPSTLMERRPDIRRSEQELIAANAAVGQAYTNRFPRLSLTAGYGLESDEFSHFLESPMYWLGASLLGPIFDGGKRQAEYRAQEAAYRQKEEAYKKTVLTAFKEVRDAITNYRKVHEYYVSAGELESSAWTTLTLVQKQYLAGSVGYLDVLDAQRNYFDAQMALSQAIKAKHKSGVQLYRALGGGWSSGQ